METKALPSICICAQEKILASLVSIKFKTIKIVPGICPVYRFTSMLKLPKNASNYRMLALKGQKYLIIKKGGGGGGEKFRVFTRRSPAGTPTVSQALTRTSRNVPRVKRKRCFIVKHYGQVVQSAITLIQDKREFWLQISFCISLSSSSDVDFVVFNSFLVVAASIAPYTTVS